MTHIRWMIRRDEVEVLEIEKNSFEFPWSKDEFIRVLRQRNCISMVVDLDDKVVGYMVYCLHKSRLHILNFAVAKEYRRQGFGTRMITKLYNKLSFQRRTMLRCEIRESNLEAQLFFRSNGFKATNVIRDYYEDTDESVYVMNRRLTKESVTV